MMFITTPGILLEHLKNLNPVLTTNKTNPILEGFLFELKDNMLLITAYNDDLRIRTSVAVNPSPTDSNNFKDGFVINGKKIIEILQSLPEEPLTFILLPEEASIKLKTEHGEYKISVFDGEGYPSADIDQEPIGTFTINSDIFKTGLEKTLFAVCEDVDLRPNLSGVYCQFHENEAIFVSTDTHRLIEYIRTDSRPETNVSFTIPKKNIPVLIKILDKYDDATEIKYGKGFINLRIGEYLIFSKLVSGEFPKYRDVFPTKTTKHLIVDKSAFTASLRRVKVFASLDNNKVIFEMNGSILKMSAANEEYNESATEYLSCTYNGEHFQIAFNANYVLEQIQQIDSEQLSFEMTESSRPTIIRPYQEKAGEKITSLLMPILV